MYKIAISDLDGTLLTPMHKVSTTTKQAVDSWKKADKAFVIATGRHYIEAKRIQEDLGEPIYLITSNGARVHDPEGNIMLKQNLPTEIATTICNYDFDPSVQINLFTDHSWYANFSRKELKDMCIDTDFFCQECDLKSIDKSNTIKIFFYGEREKLDIIYKILNEQFAGKVNLTFSLDMCLEVMEANTNKGAAVNAVLKEMNLTEAQAIAFGDGMNDVEMLKSVGKPILMKNSQNDLLNALPEAEITLSSRDDGVAVKLNKLLQSL